MKDEPNKITATLKVVITGEFYDDEASEETLRYCVEQDLEDAGFDVDVELLKEQDPVKPHYNARTNWYECGACHYSMTSGMHCRSELIPATKVRYCANCGFPVNWEGW